MATISSRPFPSLWEEICERFDKQRRAQERGEKTLSPRQTYFDSAVHSPVFFGKRFAQISGDYKLGEDVDPAVSHPALAGFWFSDAPLVETPPPAKTPPDKKTCTNRVFLERYVWPWLLPALEMTLIQAKLEGCFGLKKVSFNCMDFLTEYLYNHNPQHEDRGEVDLFDIPFVRDWLELHPRPPQPISLTWTEDETAVKIQCVWRGYIVRRDSEVQELRRWQKEWRILNREGTIQSEVSGFWEKVLGDASRNQAQQKKRMSVSTSGITLESPHSSLDDEDTKL